MLCWQETCKPQYRKYTEMAQAWELTLTLRGCLVAKWLKRWTTDPGVPGSSPTIATGIFFHLGVYSALPKNVSRCILKFTSHSCKGCKAVSPGVLVSISIQLLFPASSLATLLVVSLQEKKKGLFLIFTNQLCVPTADCVHGGDYGGERVSHNCDVQDR